MVTVFVDNYIMWTIPNSVRYTAGDANCVITYLQFYVYVKRTRHVMM